MTDLPTTNLAARPEGLLRLGLLVVNGFAAIAAIGGGLALVANLESARFPAAWLAGTPFSSYLVPGTLLAAVVGGSSLLAFVAAVVRARRAGLASVGSGLVMIAWIVGEIAILTRDHEFVSATELFFLALGLAMAGLGVVGIRASRS
jgi:hypothetical protein